MGFFNSGTKLAENPKKKIKGLRKVIAELNKIVWIRMGFSNSGTKFAENSKKKIEGLQKVIAELNKIVWIRLGFFNSGTKSTKNLKKKIKGLQKVIVKVNKDINIIGQYEKLSRDEGNVAARKLEEAIASKFDDGRTWYLEMVKSSAEENANFIATWRLILVKELDDIKRLQRKHIEALEDGDFATQQTRHFCFFF